MRAGILAGALAALLYGSLAGAQVEPLEEEPGLLEEEVPVLDDPQDFGLDVAGDEEGLGGAAGEGLGALPEYDVETVPVWPEPGVVRPDPGLEDREAELLRGTGVFGAPLAMPRDDLPSPVTIDEDDVTPGDVGLGGIGFDEAPFEPFEEDEEAFGGGGIDVATPAERADMRGVTVLVGAGVEGYTGELAPNVNPGGMAGVSASFRPSRVLGLELGYSAALNDLDRELVGFEGDGVDIVRNGGHAALTLGLTATPVQPYVLGGVGVSYYDVRNGQEAGFEDDTVGSVPVGLGLRSHIGSFVADARLNYNFLLGQQFAPAGDDLAGSYAAMFNLGGTF